MASCDANVNAAGLASSTVPIPALTQTDGAMDMICDIEAVDSTQNVEERDADGNSADDAVRLAQLFATQQQSQARRAQNIFGNSEVPQELLDAVNHAHESFPVYIRDPFSKKAILLCGDSAHLLKRDRNLLHSTMNARQSLEVHFDGSLVRLNSEYIAALGADDRAAQESGLPEQEPLLTDTFVNLTSWGKMSVPGALAVYSPRVVSALRQQARSAVSTACAREFQALAKHLEIGRARFDVCRSKTLNSLHDAPLRAALTSYNTPAVAVLRDIEGYYKHEIDHGRSTSRSTIWQELLSATVAMRCYIFREFSHRPADGYVVLSRISTDPLESIFSYARQSNGGCSNPTVNELVLSVRRSAARNASSQALRCAKGNVEPERNQEALNEIFLADSVIGRQYVPSATTRRRMLQDDIERVRLQNSTVMTILTHARGPSSLRLDMKMMRVSARICGALITLERKKVSRSINRLAAKSCGEETRLSRADQKLFAVHRTDLSILHAMALPRDAHERNADVFSDIREIERQNGLTYPKNNMLCLFYALVISRHHALHHVMRSKQDLEVLPSVLTKLFEKVTKDHEHTCGTSPVLHRVVARFRNSSCRSLQATLNQRSASVSPGVNILKGAAGVALRPSLAVKMTAVRDARNRNK